MALSLPLVGDDVYISPPGDSHHEDRYAIVEIVGRGYHIKPYHDRSGNPSLISYHFQEGAWKVMDAAGNFHPYTVRIQFNAVAHINKEGSSGRYGLLMAIHGMFSDKYALHDPDEDSIDDINRQLKETGLVADFGSGIHAVEGFERGRDLYEEMSRNLKRTGGTERVLFLLDWLKRNYIINPEEVIRLAASNDSVPIMEWILENDVTFEGLNEDEHDVSTVINEEIFQDDKVEMYKFVIQIPGIVEIMYENFGGEKGIIKLTRDYTPESQIAGYVESSRGKTIKPVQAKHVK